MELQNLISFKISSVLCFPQNTQFLFCPLLHCHCECLALFQYYTVITTTKKHNKITSEPTFGGLSNKNVFINVVAILKAPALSEQQPEPDFPRTTLTISNAVNQPRRLRAILVP